MLNKMTAKWHFQAFYLVLVWMKQRTLTFRISTAGGSSQVEVFVPLSLLKMFCYCHFLWGEKNEQKSESVLDWWGNEITDQVFGFLAWAELCCHGSAGEDGEGSSFFSASEVVLRARSGFFSLGCSWSFTLKHTTGLNFLPGGKCQAFSLLV